MSVLVWRAGTARRDGTDVCNVDEVCTKHVPSFSSLSLSFLTLPSISLSLLDATFAAGTRASMYGGLPCSADTATRGTGALAHGTGPRHWPTALARGTGALAHGIGPQHWRIGPRHWRTGPRHWPAALAHWMAWRGTHKID